MNALPQEFLKADAQELSCKSSEIVAGLKRKPTELPASQYWDPFTTLQCGHFKCTDLQKIRRELLSQGISPKIILDGVGSIKRLQFGECTIHRWPAESTVCMAFLEELSAFKAHNLAYRGESLASFNMMVFDCLCEVKPRPSISGRLRYKIVSNQRHLCALCGDMLTDDMIIDHIIPRAALGSDNIENLHAICSLCDKLKTFDDKSEIQIEEKKHFCPDLTRIRLKNFVCQESLHKLCVICIRMLKIFPCLKLM